VESPGIGSGNSNGRSGPGGGPPPPEPVAGQPRSLMGGVIHFFLANKLVTGLLVLLLVGWGVSVAPFDWEVDWLPRRPVPVDAIPNLGENQQIVMTEWPGRSPQDVEDQVTYPLTTALLGVPGVREVRSSSAFGLSMVFLIFEEGVEFYWSRARIIEKLNSLPPNLLPMDAMPTLGPDATALGQVFWYTLEGRDHQGHPVGGWDLDELRGVQDWFVRYGLLASEGVSEVASLGGYVREYQVDVDRDAMRIHGVTLDQILDAAASANLDIGAGTTEINRVEYVIRGRGFIRTLEDLEEAVVRIAPGYLPVRLGDVAHVSLGPAPRRGALTVAGAEAVGGVVVVREGFNPLQAIQNVKARIAEISPGLPAKAFVDWTRTDRARLETFAAAMGFQAFTGSGVNHPEWVAWLSAQPPEAWPQGVTLSQLEIVPVYDRTGLIHETLGTLSDALVQQILITIIVVILMLMNLRASFVISSMLPLAVLGAFVGMKLVGVEANVVALAGIAIAIGTIVDMGLIITENVIKHLDEASPDEDRLQVVWRGSREVGSAVLTAIATTIISFLPVFTMTGPEGKMFTPLAFTKTFVLLASVVLALTVVPSLIHLVMGRRVRGDRLRRMLLAGFPPRAQRNAPVALNVAVAVLFVAILASVWEPLGPGAGGIRNFLFAGGLIALVLGVFALVHRYYATILGWALDHKALFLSLPGAMVVLGLFVWLGFGRVLGFVPATVDRLGLDGDRIRLSTPWVAVAHEFPGLGREFMPPLDEGSFLWMPTTMPHASLGEALEVLQYQDMAIASVPEVETVVGKIGRAESALDPAPISMIETIITYNSEYVTDQAGRRLLFRYDRRRDEFVRDDQGELIPDRGGRPYRQWREHIRSPRDIWDEIAAAAHLPGTTSAPRLQPIETRLVMLQTGMRAPMGIKLRAPDLETLDRMAVELERLVREVPAVRRETVNAERVMGKPYLEIEVDRRAIARYGLAVMDVQRAIAASIGGVTVTTTVEGRERYPVRVRYAREQRSGIEDLEQVLIPAMDGAMIPLAQVAEIAYVRGPDMIRSEDTFLTAYVTFSGVSDMAEVEVVESVQAYLDSRVESGDLVVPAGVSWRFSGTYENQLHAAATLRVVLPVALIIILLILYFQFRSLPTTLMIFSGIAVAWAGGFVMIYFYGQDWFANFALFGVNMRELFQLHPINLSVAVWVGFLALFGIAVDDGVLMATYLRQRFRETGPSTAEDIRRETVYAGLRRVRPALMTSATTVLALLPVLTSTGRGADVMIPMAIPTVGGMTLAVITMFTVPVLWSWWEETKLRPAGDATPPSGPAGPDPRSG